MGNPPKQVSKSPEPPSGPQALLGGSGDLLTCFGGLPTPSKGVISGLELTYITRLIPGKQLLSGWGRPKAAPNHIVAT